MKLTHESVGKQFSDELGCTVNIAMKHPYLTESYVGVYENSEFVYIFNSEGVTNSNAGDCTVSLVSLYTPPRTLEEVAKDMYGVLTNFISTGELYNGFGKTEALLKEYKNIRSGE